MTQRAQSISGIYAPNHWPWTEWEQRVMLSECFSWAVVRLDLPEEAFKFCYDSGLRIVAQQVDLFNKSYWRRPWNSAETLARKLAPVEPYIDSVCFDNEPNVVPATSSNWYAEQWRRYHDAFMACWDFLDHTNRYKLISPALSWRLDRHAREWDKIAHQNNRYNRLGAVHAYWWDDTSRISSNWGNGLSVIIEDRPFMPNYILEYANVSATKPDYDKGREYAAWLASLPKQVQCACYFIAGGTRHWKQWFITEAVLEGLAGGLGLTSWERG